MVFPGRLVTLLREHGWPCNLCDWIGSFVTERSISIILDSETGLTQDLNRGLPQGSPASPFLFMLYISPLFWLKSLQKAFGYADDIAILESSPSLEENPTKIEIAINHALEWGQQEGITFEPSKSELLHFSRRYKDKSKSPPVKTKRFTITESDERLYLKCLVVHFDRKLTFKSHVTIQTSKALNVTHALRYLGNTTRGFPPRLARQAIVACVLPIAHFAAETW